TFRSPPRLRAPPDVVPPVVEPGPAQAATRPAAPAAATPRRNWRRSMVVPERSPSSPCDRSIELIPMKACRQLPHALTERCVNGHLSLTLPYVVTPLSADRSPGYHTNEVITG